jgi:hypothetical protein
VTEPAGGAGDGAERRQSLPAELATEAKRTVCATNGCDTHFRACNGEKDEMPCVQEATAVAPAGLVSVSSVNDYLDTLQHMYYIS